MKSLVLGFETSFGLGGGPPMFGKGVVEISTTLGYPHRHPLSEWWTPNAQNSGGALSPRI